MAGGRLRLELLAAGAEVGAFQLLDAVSAGTLDGGHGVPAYWFGKNKAFSLFGTSPPWFGDANQLLGWYHYGGGEALYNELLNDHVKVNVVSFMTGPMPTQPLGWFKNPIERPEQIRGLKYRTVGLSVDIFNGLSAANGLRYFFMPDTNLVAVCVVLLPSSTLIQKRDSTSKPMKTQSCFCFLPR